MKILALLQNQWYKNPENARRMFERWGPERRHRLIRRTLFAGCLSGRRLMKAFGEELVDQIIWEEVSPQIGGHSGSRFPPDREHLSRVLIQHTPDIVMFFGKVARSAFDLPTSSEPLLLPWPREIIHGPHPAARHAGVSEELQEMASTLKQMLSLL